eukprot:5921763-Prymnesium_polylepis.1
MKPLKHTCDSFRNEPWNSLPSLLIFTGLTGRARCALRVLVIGTGRDREDRTTSTTLRRLHVPEISRGRLTVTSSLVKTMGAPHWAIKPFSIVTGAVVVFSHERATGMAIESQTSSIFAKAANSGPGSLPHGGSAR